MKLTPPAPIAALFLGFALIGGLSELGIALAQQPPSIEERMVSDTDAVLGVLRTWHNQISQDQAIIKGQAERLSAVEKVTAGEPGQVLHWKDTKWEWIAPPPPADKPVEAPGR